MRAENYIPSGRLNDKAIEWMDQIRRTVAPRQVCIRPPECVLLIIDMNHYFVHPQGRAFLPATIEVVPVLRELLHFWREQNGMVVYTRHGHSGSDDLGTLGTFFSDYIRDDAQEAEIVAELLPRSTEPVIRKRTYDAFLDTGLQRLLRERKMSQVLITGVLTQMCCETTARSAFCRGFEVFTPVDGMVSTTEAFHLHSLMSLSSCVSVPLRIPELIESCGM